MSCRGSIFGRMEGMLFEFNLKGYLRFGHTKAGEIESGEGHSKEQQKRDQN